VVLALMRLGEDAYGVPISQEIEEIGGREVAPGTVYTILERLEEKVSRGRCRDLATFQCFYL